MIEDPVSEHVPFAHEPPEPAWEGCVETIATQLVYGDQHHELGRRRLDDWRQQADGERENERAAEHGRGA